MSNLEREAAALLLTWRLEALKQKEPNWQATELVVLKGLRRRWEDQIPHSFLHKECGVSFLIE